MQILCEYFKKLEDRGESGLSGKEEQGRAGHPIITGSEVQSPARPVSFFPC